MINDVINELKRHCEVTEVYPNSDITEATRTAEAFKNTLIDRLKQAATRKEWPTIALVMVTTYEGTFNARYQELIDVIETICREFPQLRAIFEWYSFEEGVVTCKSRS